MPESVIKRLNELALADGRVKGKGEIYTKPTSNEQDSGAKSDLSDTIDSPVNDGVDPAILHLDIHDETDIIDTLDEVQYDNGGEAKPYNAPITDYGFKETRDQQSVFVIDPVQTLIRITETKSSNLYLKICFGIL